MDEDDKEFLWPGRRHDLELLDEELELIEFFRKIKTVGDFLRLTGTEE